MKILFWNIGRSITKEKFRWIEKAVHFNEPDVLCFAEGPESIKDCKSFVNQITALNYYCYYNPTLYSDKVISNQFGWNKFGLKVFLKNGSTTNPKFSFGDQKVEGRIIHLRFEKNGYHYSTFLIHGMSKQGDDIDQNDFIIELARFIQFKTLDPNDRIIILGDFNIEPWETLLRKGKYILSFFYKKLQDYHTGRVTKRIYSSPVFEYVQSHSDQKLVGTFYGKSHVSLFDFPLISDDFNGFDFDIITNISGQDLMTRTNKKNYLIDGFDHLPISLKLK